MSRSGYSESRDNWAMVRWRGAVAASIRSDRGQDFLHELLDALDALPVKELCSGALANEGAVCALGSVVKARGELDSPKVKEFNERLVKEQEDGWDCGNVTDDMAGILNIPRALAAEIMNENDDCYISLGEENPKAARFRKVRQWVMNQIEQTKKLREVTT